MAMILAPPRSPLPRLRPASPRTPVDLFSALVLSPSRRTAMTVPPSAVPSLVLCPPSPPDTPIPSHRTPPPTPPAAASTTAVQPRTDEAASAGAEPIFRPLSHTEARQLTLLLHQSLFPARASPKALMHACIALAEQLHAAGIRWDRRRRVMGMHLRGIWEEGGRLGMGSGAREVGGEGHRAMERYVQGSFLSIAEDPHPLDPLPLPIAVSGPPAAFPTLTLQAGLAQTLGATSSGLPMWASASGADAREVGRTLPPSATLSVFTPSVTATSAGMTPGPGGARGMREKNKAGLRVSTGIPLHPRSRALQIPYSASSASAHLAHRGGGTKLTGTFGLIVAAIMGRRGRGHFGRVTRGTKLGGKKMRARDGHSHLQLQLGMSSIRARLGMVGGRRDETQTAWGEITTARRVSFGGWEVR